jgi:D-alanine transaminase
VSGEPAALCLLDGRIVPLAEARISPLDRGFLFGDSVYEVVKILGGRPLFLDRHLARLDAGLEAMAIPVPGALEPALVELVAANALGDAALYLQVTRGAPPQRTHLPPPGFGPTVFAMASGIEYPEKPEIAPGLTAISRDDDRWGRCDIKTTALAATVLGKLAAAGRGATESLFTGPGGELREGGNTSLFVRDDTGWHTHPLGREILPGVTRAVILEAAKGATLAIEDRAPLLAGRGGWHEAFLAGTTTGVRGLIELDGAPVGDGAVGPETRRCARLLADAEEREAARG